MKRIVMIDPSFLIPQMLELLLGAEGVSFRAVPDGGERFQQEVKKGVDGLFIGARALEGKGEELLQLLHRDECLASLPKLVFLEADAEHVDRKLLESIPRALFLPKPFHPDELLKQMKRMKK